MTTSSFRPLYARSDSDVRAGNAQKTAIRETQPEVHATGVGRLGWRWFLASAIAACVAVVAHAYFLGWTTPFGLFGNGIDTIVYRHGAYVVQHGEPLYEFALFDIGLPFTYPPFAALAFAPLALLSVTSAVTVVQAINLLLIYVAVVASWRALGYRSATMYLVSVGLAVALTWLEPVRMTIWLGQINMLLLVFVLLDLTRGEGSRLRGVGVGIAAGLKLTPAFFVLHLLAQRQWQAAVTAIAAFTVTVLAGLIVIPADSWRFWTSTMIDSERIGALASPANQSIHGVLARLWPGNTPPFAVWLVLALVVAALALWVAARAQAAGKTLLALTICGMATPMVSPFAWGHHWVWCIPLTVLALDYANRHRTWWSWLAPIAVTTPMIAWYFTDYRGIKAIGIFMFEGSPAFEFAVQFTYPAVFLATLVVVFVGLRIRPTAGHDDARQ
ncbi:alpha-1,2-mannosyltransferase [Rhodococcus fascians]|uniref:glycosyltransferase 87 family protein n=1 Tax=Nocardiaceae TaxID=85025 RepID=UPI00285EE3FA|nr:MULTISPECIES: glycosyltransferase 87 family protein [Rhodococcus]MDR6909217.1 alpha-1,2-mannosyltransferase [Rhodococcus sp. 3258]MDR6929966.1 alpha-1,2-mannosyltransferase [Rhodococcus fascians]